MYAVHTVVETAPCIWSVFHGDERHPCASFADIESANLYASMRAILVEIKSNGEYRVDAWNHLADFAERHHREVVKRCPGIDRATRRAA